MTDMRSLAEVKGRLSEVVDEVEQTHQRVVLMRNGRPAAVLISPDDLEALEETIEILSDPELMRQMQEAEEDYRGEFITGDELRRRYFKR